MLVITRNANQTIEIGDGVVITVLSIRGGRVKLGIDAPADVVIRRGVREVEAGPSRPPLSP